MEILSLLALGALAWLWLDSIKVRELACGTARHACEREGLQLLDDTVAISSIRLARNGDGRMKLRRGYVFEYSDTGNNRCRGSLVMLGRRELIVHVGLRLVRPEPTLH